MNAPHHPELNAMAGRSIGAILMDAGRLSPADAERILRVQREEQLMFGEAAQKLKVLVAEDIAFAMSRQFEYPYLIRGRSPVSERVVAAFEPFSAAVEALRGVRSQLMLRWFGSAKGRRSLVVSSAAAGEGRSWLVANLGVVFSQLGQRTLIVDADLRRPSQHLLFGQSNRSGLSTILSGRAGSETIVRVPELLDLSVLVAGPVPPNPQELLSRTRVADLLAQLEASYDVILVDTPPAGLYAEAATLAVRAGAALVATRLNQSRVRDVRAHCAALREAGVNVIGSVLTGADAASLARRK